MSKGEVGGASTFSFTTEHSGGKKSDLEDVDSPVISHKGSLERRDFFFLFLF